MQKFNSQDGIISNANGASVSTMVRKCSEVMRELLNSPLPLVVGGGRTPEGSYQAGESSDLTIMHYLNRLSRSVV